MIGKTISHYKILEKLGSGGMGVVYKAQDTKLDRFVALKFLPPHLSQDEENKKRFIHEAKAASALNHPNIATIYEIDEADGQMFIAMEYIEGQSLQALINIPLNLPSKGDFKKSPLEGGAASAAGGVGRPLPLETCLNYAIQIAEGLQAAHEKQIIHRDIKPANILITEKEQVKIVDFGLAKLAGRTQLTKEGTSMGTVAYMSPEQTQGAELDHRTDIWALGAVLYEMISGRQPFEGDYEQAVVYSIMNEQPEPVTGLRAGVPMELERIVLKALAKEPAERYQHADELLTDLRTLGKELEPRGKTAPVTVSRAAQGKPVWRKATSILAGGLALFLLLFALQRVFRSEGAREAVAKDKSIAVLPLTTITQSEEDEIFSEGMHDDIITQLAKIHDLKVIARTSVMRYKNTQKRISEIGKELGVGAILEGSVRRAGNRVRIVAQLIDAKSEEHIWAETYDRDYADVFVIQSDVAQKIALALEAALSPAEKREIDQIPTDNMQAWEYYQKGMYYWHNFLSLEGNEKALAMFEKAVEMDSNFVSAYAWLSTVNSGLASWSETDTLLTRKHLPAAKTALDRAIALDPNHPQVHAARGDYLFFIKKDYHQARKEYQLALRKQPNNSDLFEAIGRTFSSQRKMEQAVEYYKKQYELDPFSVTSGSAVSGAYENLRKWQQAEKWATKYIAKHPEHGFGYTQRAEILLWGFGNLEKAGIALEEGIPYLKKDPKVELTHNALEVDYLLYSRAYLQAKKFLESNSKVPQRFIRKGFTYSLLGDDSLARANYDSAVVKYEKQVKANPVIATYYSSLGLAYAGLGRQEEAIREGKKAVELKPTGGGFWFDGERFLLQLAYIYILVGEYDQAIDALETLLAIPSQLTVSRLKLDPRYYPLRDLPRFQRLLDKYAEKS